MQVTAVGELAAIEDNKTQIGNVKNHRLRFRIVRVLNELEGHDVIALKSRQVASDVSKQVHGVRAASAGLGLLIHSCSEPFPLLGSCISSDWSWSVRRPKLVVILGCLPEVIEQRQLGFCLSRVGLAAEAAIDPLRNSDILAAMFNQDGQFDQRIKHRQTLACDVIHVANQVHSIAGSGDSHVHAAVVGIESRGTGSSHE